MGLSVLITGAIEDYSMTWFLPREAMFLAEILEELDPAIKGQIMVDFEITNENIGRIADVAKQDKFQSRDFYAAHKYIKQCREELRNHPDILLHFMII